MGEDRLGRGYCRGMRARLPLPRLLPDLLAALFVAVLIEVDVWRRSGMLGTHIAGGLLISPHTFEYDVALLIGANPADCDIG